MINTLVKLSNQFAYGDTPSRQDYDALYKQGYRSLIDLRTHRELGDGHDFREVLRIARNHGLEYYHLSVTEDQIQPDQIENLRNRLPAMPPPYYAYPAVRAGVMLTLHIMLEERVSGDRAKARALDLGFDANDEKTWGFLKQYLDEHMIRPF